MFPQRCAFLKPSHKVWHLLLFISLFTVAVLVYNGYSTSSVASPTSSKSLPRQHKLILNDVNVKVAVADSAKDHQLLQQRVDHIPLNSGNLNVHSLQEKPFNDDGLGSDLKEPLLAEKSLLQGDNFVRNKDSLQKEEQIPLVQKRQILLVDKRQIPLLQAAKVSTEKRRVLVYSCNKILVCGGWADRQKGIVTGYVLSVMMGRDFKIDMPRPCDINLFLIPNEVDWILRAGETENYSVGEVEGIDAHGYDVVNQLLQKDDLEIASFDKDYVFITWNMELVSKLRTHRLAKTVPWLSDSMSLGEIYRLVLHKLFKLSSALSTMLNVALEAQPSSTKLVCAQVRMGGSQEFSDSLSFNSLDGVEKLLVFLGKYNDPKRFRMLVASDSKQVVDMVKNRFRGMVLEMPGPITHIDKSTGKDICAGFVRAILDQIALSTCDVLVISESGLGKIAAFLRNTDDELYLFHNGKVQQFTRQMSFPSRPYW